MIGFPGVLGGGLGGTGASTVPSNQLTFAGGSSLTDNGSGGGTWAAGGTNQSLNLTPSGTGSVSFPNGTATNPAINFPGRGATVGFYALSATEIATPVSTFGVGVSGGGSTQVGASGGNGVVSVINGNGSNVVNLSAAYPGGTSQASPALSLINPNLSLVGTPQQYAPARVDIAHAWNTSGTPADNYVQMIQQLTASTGASPAGTWTVGFSTSTTATPSYTTAMSLSPTALVMGTGVALQLSSTYAAGVVAATGTVDIKDSTGTVYHVLVHT